MAHGTARRTRICDLLASASAGTAVRVNGWVKTSRFSKNVSFVHLFDGSTPQTVQVVLPAETDPGLKSQLGTGTAVEVHGEWVESQGGKQTWEILAGEIRVVGAADGTYPLQKLSLIHISEPTRPY